MSDMRHDWVIVRPEVPVHGRLGDTTVKFVAAGRTSEEGRTVLNLGLE